MLPDTTPILIVGAGPVGLSLAGDLGWRGVGCTLIEKTDGAIVQPKMDMVGVRTMEFCRRWGIAKDVEYSPYPRDYPQDNVWLESFTGFEFGREPMVSKAEEPKPPQSPQKRERCPQDMFDPILRKFVGTMADATVAYETELVDFTEDSDGVTAIVRTGMGDTRKIRAGFLVGTDGAASTVRRKLGIKMHGKPVLTYTTNVIFRCKDLPSLHDKGKAYRFIFIGPEGTWLTIVAIDGADRWRMSIVGSKEKREVPEEEIHAYIRRAMGKDFDYEIESVMPWVRRQLVASSYGTNRVFLAGDSCHLTSPTGGFGMNTGIADAIDLAWKLEAVHKGWGGPHLLPSYTIERKPVAIRAVTEAGRNLGRMLATRTKAPPPVAFETGPAAEAARKVYGDWYTETMKPEWFSNGIHLGYTYYHSPVVCPDGSQAPVDDVSDPVQTGRPGHRAPHIWLYDGRSSLDLFAKGFTLIRFKAEVEVEALLNAAGQMGIPVTLVDLFDEAEMRDLYGADLSLVRPDGHVGWRGDTVGADSEKILSVVSGHKKSQEAEIPPDLVDGEIAGAREGMASSALKA
ncbi:FAD-dependent monooxygenase [Oceanicola sp. 502str15]|uniref:FAD-dependent monooxygenase n=1 Tax=Oceanicola sp. 502str15 TaxID=2696061 RepID=UPI00209653A0|nr:FAD-dependent monooxygenase [Oceanicola sp. 502str15]MCO6385297.1 2-polyprenyl-6-methoxyphenol hydroxylase [Oceanicola sp. 502str15]